MCIPRRYIKQSFLLTVWLLTAGIPFLFAQQPQPSGNQVLRVTTDSSPTKAVVTIYLQDRAVVFALPNSGDVAYVSSVAAPNGKLATQADATTSISLRPGAIPGLETKLDNPATNIPKVIPKDIPKAIPPVPKQGAVEVPGVGTLEQLQRELVARKVKEQQ